jgi:DNA helicase-2/ATP-dependent DNA helicase PcrA
LLNSNAEVLNRCRSRYKYIQVDEGQDTSRIQHEIIKLVSKPINNIFLVGDEDQSIYGFRGAFPDAILKFEEDYGKAKVFFMEENFRSTKKIVSAAGEFIKSNTERYDKNIYTNREEGKEIQIKILDNEYEQLDFLVENLKNNGNYKDTAVIFRNNISVIPVADRLNKNEIPFYIRDSKSNFFNNWVVLDIVSFLNLSIWNDNIESFERIYYKMNSYIPKKAVEYIKGFSSGESVFDLLKQFQGLNSYQIKRLDGLKESFIHLSGMKPEHAIEYIERELSYKEYL